MSFCTVYHVIFKMNGNSFSEKGLMCRGSITYYVAPENNEGSCLFTKYALVAFTRYSVSTGLHHYPFEIGALGISIILIFFLGASYQKMNLTSSTSTIAVVLCVLLSAVAAVHSSHGRLGSSVISNGSGRHLKKEKCTDECQEFEGETNAGGKNRIPICFIFPEQGESSAPQKDFCQTRCVSATEAEAAIADGEGTCGVCPEFDTTRNTNCPK